MVPRLEEPNPIRRAGSTSGEVPVNPGAEHDEPSSELRQWPPDVATTWRSRSHGLSVRQREGHRNAWYPSAASASSATSASTTVVFGAGVRGKLQGSSCSKV